MLIRFVVSNFLSFREEREFNMLAGPFKTHKHHVYPLGKIDVLKATALYGANGAGKSNFVKAIEYFQGIVKDGVIIKSINDKKFKLDNANIEQPVHFEMEFFTVNKIFSYGVTIDHISIVEEWLYESGITTDDKLIFKRTLSNVGKPSIKMADKYMKTQKARLLIELMEDNLLKNNELLLSKSDSIKSKDISNAHDWIKNNLVVIFPSSRFQGLVPMITTSDNFKTFANELLKTFDTGVKELGVETIDFYTFFGAENEKIKKELIDDLEKEESFLFNSETGVVLITNEKDKYLVKKVIALHEDSKSNRVKFDLNEESDGTQRLLDIIPAFNFILIDDVTIIIDEIDQSLHPALLKALVHKIMTDKSTKGQIIFTTHESNLLDLDLFRQDEIWFAEKNKKSESTELYSLSEFKPRYDLDIRKGYLKGRFGAIPFLANLNDLNWHVYDEEKERV